jgi:hypothetical protein
MAGICALNFAYLTTIPDNVAEDTLAGVPEHGVARV